MQTTIDATATQKMFDIAMLVQKAVGLRLIPAKMLCGCQSNGHDFGIADPTLAIFPMVKCLQNIITKAENCYNLTVHVSSWFGCGFSNFNFTRSRMDFLLI